jgi:hypothetical protein
MLNSAASSVLYARCELAGRKLWRRCYRCDGHQCRLHVKNKRQAAPTGDAQQQQQRRLGRIVGRLTWQFGVWRCQKGNLLAGKKESLKKRSTAGAAALEVGLRSRGRACITAPVLTAPQSPETLLDNSHMTSVAIHRLPPTPTHCGPAAPESQDRRAFPTSIV